VRKLWKWAAAAGVAVVIASVAGVTPAFADPPTGYGFDDQPHVVVAGGSDTTYKAMLGLTELYMNTSIGGCQHVTTVGPDLNKCSPTGSPETNSNLANYQGDTFANANPTGSSAGIGSLNGNVASSTSDAGAVHPVNITCPNSTVVTTTGPNVDFARSSRGPKTSGGASRCSGNELDIDTFWGYGEDGIEVAAFTGTRGAELQGVGGGAFTATQLFHIWNCDGGTGAGGRMKWSDLIPSIAGQPRGDALVEPWGVNASAGTFSSFQSFIQNNASGVPAGWSPDGQSCDRKLASGLFPLENDIKQPILNGPALSTDPSSPDNPENWIHWGSFGVLSASPFLNSITVSARTFTYTPAPINGILPSSAGIIGLTYPIGRTVYHVTLKRDADCVKTGSACDFPGHPGPAIATGGNDLNVTGGTGGVSGAIREYTRFLCRGSSAQHAKNPFTGTNNFSEITTRINLGGFTVVPASLRTSGSRCQVLS
jgi:hypothetical protein